MRPPFWAGAGQDGRDADSLLMSRIADGDEAAFRKLVDEHIDRVHALALRFTGQRADAEDIAQEAFLRVWKSAGKWQPGRARLSTWLHRIVVNLCIDRARRGKTRRHADLDEAEAVPDPSPGLDRAHMARVTMAATEAEIANLPERQRAALLLSVMAGHSNPEIADILGVSVGAVEQALVRARRRLRQRLSDAL